MDTTKWKSVLLPRDLYEEIVVIARVEGNITEKELVVLCDIADGLDIPRSLVSNILESETELD